MAESELSVSYADLVAEVAAFLGYGSDPAGDALAECDRHVQAGYRRFLYPPAVEGVQAGYSWSFLSPVTTIATVASDQAQDLPADLARVIGSFYYGTQDQLRPAVMQIGEGRYQALVGRAAAESSPQFACVRHKANTAPATGQRLEVAWWPTPDAAYTLTYKYEAYTGKLSAQNPYPLGGMKHAELLVESCLAVAEVRSNDEVRGIHSDEFERMLRAAVEQDRGQGAQHYGAMGSNPDGPATVPLRGDTGSTHTITYNGVAIT